MLRPIARLTGMHKQMLGVFAVMGMALLCLSACVSAQSALAVSPGSAPASDACESLPSSPSVSEGAAQSGPPPALRLPEAVADPSADPLTGLPRDEDAPAGTRPLAVLIDNLQAALPQRGLQQADLVFEAVTEGGVTRLVAVFSDYAAMPQTGPVCFAREPQLRLTLGLDTLYLFAGASPEAKELLAQYRPEAAVLDARDRTGALSLDAQRSLSTAIEHCWFTDGELFSAAAQRYELACVPEGAPRAAFQFVPPDQEPRRLSDGDAGEVYVRFSSYANSAFTYDADAGQYVKSQFGAPHIDENTGEAVTFDNLLILFSAGADAADGEGFYVCGSRYEAVRWAREAPDAPLCVLTTDENPTLAAINPGRTYVAMVGRELSAYFRIDGSAVLSSVGEP